jgi:hypothetical protein
MRLMCLPLIPRLRNGFIVKFSGTSKRLLIFPDLLFTSQLAHPARLPRHGKDVMLLLIADKRYAHRAYYSRLLAIFRCLPARPIYLDGFPISAQHLSSLAHYSYKYLQYVKSLLRLVRNGEPLGLRESAARSMYIPLGCFSHFEPSVVPMSSCDLDYAFLGSVTYNSSEKKWFHAFMESPKEAARRVMCESIREISAAGRWRGFLHTTGDYERKYEQPGNLRRHTRSMQISLFPRGTCYDTYLFLSRLRLGVW